MTLANNSAVGFYRQVRWGLTLIAQPIVLLLFRLAWGLESAQSGWGHLHHVADTADFFRSLHIPFPVLNVYIAGGTELVGGVLLILGLGARVAALPFAFNFLIAIITAGHGRIVQKFQEGVVSGLTAGIIDDTAFPFLMLGLLVLAFGPGLISIDALIRHALLGGGPGSIEPRPVLDYRRGV